MKRLVQLVIVLVWILPAGAIDPGFAKGSMQVAAESFPLTHAYAQLHDNAEGLLDRPKEMRILVADREVPQDVLNGLVFLPVRAMAREGGVRGLLITFDPREPKNVLVTFLYPPNNPAASLITQTRSSTEGVIQNLKISDTRVSGEIESRESGASGSGEMPPVSYAASFSAPLFHEPPVTEDLKGQAARKSPQVKALRAAAAALKKGDFETLRKVSTERANRQTDLMLAETGAQSVEIAKEAGKEMARSADTARRVVVRGNRAVVLFPNKSWGNLERVNGEWKLDD